MGTYGRYLLLQLTGWAGIAIVMAGLVRWLDLPAWIGAGVVLAWVVKDLALYPLVRPAYAAHDGPSPAARLVGLEGRAEQDLDPAGMVRVHGELWRATTPPGTPPVRRGEVVRVLRVDRLTLTVERG